MACPGTGQPRPNGPARVIRLVDFQHLADVHDPARLGPYLKVARTVEALREAIMPPLPCAVAGSLMNHEL